MSKKSKEDEQTLEELNSAHRRLQAKCQLIQTSYIKQIKLFLFSPYNWSVWENLDLGRLYLTTSVKILPYRPPAQLIRAKWYIFFRFEKPLTKKWDYPGVY